MPDGLACTRRKILGATAGLCAGLAGCSGGEPDPGLHAVSAVVLYRPGFQNATYPSDVVVRVTVENTSGRRRLGTLVVTVTRTDRDDEREWRQERSIEVSGATTRSYLVPVADVFESAGTAAVVTATATVTAPDQG